MSAFVGIANGAFVSTDRVAPIFRAARSETNVSLRHPLTSRKNVSFQTSSSFIGRRSFVSAAISSSDEVNKVLCSVAQAEAPGAAKTQTFYYIAASEKFFTEEEEPFPEVLKEREIYYENRLKQPKDWEFIVDPAFLKSPQMAAIRSKIPGTPAAIVSTNKQFITFMKLRCEYVESGEFVAPSTDIPDAYGKS